MLMSHRWFGSALLCTVLTTVGLAQAPALDIKMGLWEITTTTQIGGQTPQVDTSKMTPEQKAQVEALMRSSMGNHSIVRKSCVTQEQLDKSNFLMTDQPNTTCKRTITANTRTTLEASVACTGEQAMTAQVHIDALSPTSIKMNMQSSGTNQGRTMTMNVVLTGKWLGADCGVIK
jgi:hypothetical protein